MTIITNMLRKIISISKNNMHIITDGETLLLLNMTTGKVHVSYPASDIQGFYDALCEFNRLLTNKNLCDADKHPHQYKQYLYTLYHKFNYGKEQKISANSRLY